ncbi:hypothetical protein FHS29_006595 [Saccharothrix tamanrassetensis]|uniref:Uncharacterized protein n=1 Tax=Saccharothrix tamanrassetensis TaxID=1051531 RepID=A0A841CSX9_9PSEU|nr:hypothetical protein [Saccharothrix tamanrassetensis]MBB5959973.1 hypothetical protein [Saccharothrix tamanrassetensis]
MSGDVTSLLRTLGFSTGPAMGAAVGGFRTHVVLLTVITAVGGDASAAEMWSLRAHGLPLGARAN